jgi:acetyltransferase-like isoleucine patch superfamily enzyme
MRNFNAGAAAPIVIEDDVFVGTDSLLLKGVTVGEASVVGAGSVVSRDVPFGTVVVEIKQPWSVICSNDEVAGLGAS